MKRPIFLSSFFSTNWSGSKFFTSAAIWQAKSVGSKEVMRAMSHLPASRLRQASSLLLPTAQMSPNPVTTTRRLKIVAPGNTSAGGRRSLGALGVFADVLYGIFDSANLLRVLVGDLDIEGFFESHYEFDCVQRIGA